MVPCGRVGLLCTKIGWKTALRLHGGLSRGHRQTTLLAVKPSYKCQQLYQVRSYEVGLEACVSNGCAS